MFVFTLQIYTIIFSTKFEPFELDREQKMVWIMFYWLQCFVSIKANSMDTYHSHAMLVFMKQGLWASKGSQFEHTVPTLLPNKNIKLGRFCQTLEYIHWQCFLMSSTDVWKWKLPVWLMLGKDFGYTKLNMVKRVLHQCIALLWHCLDSNQTTKKIKLT